MALEELRRGGFEVEDATEENLREVIGDSPVRNEQGEPPVGILRMAANPHRGAAFLAHRDRPVPGSPIHALGFEGHGRFMAGDGPRPTKELSDPPKVDIEGLIAVIDSGMAEADRRPWWMGKDYVDADGVDTEEVSQGEASHGTFVASVIRKLAPDHGIVFAAARPVAGGDMKSRHGGDPADPPTNELEVLGAVSRLVTRFGQRPSEVAALNLSLGARRCGPNDGFLLTLQASLDIWRRFFGYDAPILAAGGNSPSPEPVYPGASTWVRSVAAANPRGEQVVWRDNNEEVAQPRSWITDVAPGVKIHGLSGVSDTDTVWWSGSSFATAIATAQSVTGQSFQVDGAETYWRDQAVDYGQVDGLEHG